MNEQLVLYIKPYYPGHELFEESIQYTNDRNDRIDNSDGFNLSVIIYYDFTDENFVVLTDSLDYTLNEESNTYSVTHKYFGFKNKNVNLILFMLGRLGFQKRETNCMEIMGIYNLYKIQNNNLCQSFEKMEQLLDESSSLVSISGYRLHKLWFNDELEMLKSITVT